MIVLSAFSSIFTMVAVVMIMSFATGMIINGPALGKKLVLWEAKKLSQFAKWLVRQICMATSKFFTWIAQALK